MASIVDMKVASDERFDIPHTTATITVRSQTGEQYPGLTFLHTGDVFEDRDGREWLIQKAKVSEYTYSRYDPPEDSLGNAIECYYQWEYEALEILEPQD